MGTRRRDAQRRQISLTVEALEDRFLLSGAVSLSIPTPANGPTVHVAPAQVSAVGSETRSAFLLGNTGNPLAWQTTAFPLTRTMNYQRDDDGDNDSPDITDPDNSGKAVFGYPLLCTSD